MNVVQNINLLRKMRDAGHIRFHAHTGTLISGLYSDDRFMCYYVDDSKYSTWEIGGKKYQLKYFSGCFCPYVVALP